MQIPRDQYTLSIKVIPRAKKTEYIGEMSDGSHKIRLRAVPEDGKANEELLRFLEEETGKRWEMISGFTSSRKVVRVLL
jgi:uncharacterized protein (TIGR00251 family)